MTDTFVIALGGSEYFWLLMIWLASAIAASELSKRKGYGEKWGLGTGLLLTVVGVVIWLVVPPRANSPWHQRRDRLKAASELAKDR
jgi:uncharacterized membrane protein YbhN (UPF0104 family)